MPKTMPELYQTAGGRRFIIAIGAGLTATMLQWFGKLDPNGSAYSMIVIGCVGAYIAGATVDAVKQKGAA